MPRHKLTDEERSRGGKVRAENMRARRAEAQRIAAEVLRDAVRPRAERIAATIKLIEELRTRYAALIYEEEYEPRGTDLAALLRIEALLEGEATERVDIEDVKAALRKAIEIAAHYIAPERRIDYIDEFQRALLDEAVDEP